eukprot:183019-Pleurochrysis_carterae.AAC.2
MQPHNPSLQKRCSCRSTTQVTLLSPLVETLRTRAAAAEDWIESLRDAYQPSGIDVQPISLELQSDGTELYCFCRQPDDGMRAMLECDECGSWYHNHCVGVSNKLAKSLEHYVCPRCCRNRPEPMAYPYEHR